MTSDTMAWLSGVIVGLVYAGVAAWLLWLRAHAAGAARRVAEVEEGAEALALGRAVLRGTVRGETGPVPLEVRVLQEGTERQTRYGVDHHWSEIDRERVADPFWLDVAGCGAVWVVPSANTTLALASMDEWRQLARDRRVLRGSAEEGATLIATGVLMRGATPTAESGDGYREDASGWVLSAEVLATESGGERYRRRARLFGHAAIATLLTLLATQGLWVARYDLAVRGVRCEAVVTARQERWARNTTVTEIEARTSAACAVPGALLRGPPPAGRPEEGDWIVVRVVPAWPAHFVFGETSSHDPTATVVALVALLLGIAIGMGQWRASMAWWEVPRVASSGRGPLA